LHDTTAAGKIPRKWCENRQKGRDWLLFPFQEKGACPFRQAPFSSVKRQKQKKGQKGKAMKKPLICIGELVHASIPATGRAMKQLRDAGAGTGRSGQALDYVRGLIESQARDGANYIAVNVDAFGESDPQVAVEMMADYAGMVRKWGRGVPLCADSSDDDVLVAGLKAWYDAGRPVAAPLLNSVKVHTADAILPLKKDFDFSFVGMLVGAEGSGAASVADSVEQLCSFAGQLFDKAVGRYGFRADQIFFDTTVFPLAIDLPMEPGVPGYTRRAFETIKALRSNPKFKAVHLTMGLSNCARDLPARKVGICRAYAAKAAECGLDAVIANPAHRFGQKDPDPELAELVEAYAAMDGSPEALNRAMALMGEFCRKCRN
jgi:cobalamin-dependent methionine synthase I